MRLFSWLISALLSLSVIFFAASNLHTVEVFLTPLTPALNLPLYLVGLGLMGFGFVTGGLMVWLNEAKTRRERRTQRREIRNLQKQLGAVNENDMSAAPPSDLFPSLPKAKKH